MNSNNELIIKESEIYRECIRAPPNRSVFDLPFRCNSMGILPSGSGSGSGRGGGSTSASPGSGPYTGSKEQTTTSSMTSKTKDMSRVVLDMNGQPVVMRSKSMSTGSSTGSSLHPPALVVMVPSSPPSTSGSPSSSSSSLSSTSSVNSVTSATPLHLTSGKFAYPLPVFLFVVVRIEPISRK